MVKVCRRCGEAKPLSAFYQQGGCAQGVRPDCKECVKARRKAHHARNRDRENQASARYRQQHRDAFRRYNRVYYERHRETIRRKAVVWQARWVEQNPEKYQANVRKHSGIRRARKAATAIGPVDYGAIVEQHGMVCHLCLEGITLSTLEFDHVVPLSRGGAHTEDNIRPSHRRCNRQKYNKLLSELVA